MASFVDTLLRGGSPSLSEFLTQQAMTQPQVGPQAVPQAPQPGLPIERAGSVQPEAPAQSPVQSALQKFLGNPMLLNVLAQQGSSLTPGPSPLGVVGRAGLATNQQNMASERAGLENELLQARIDNPYASQAKPPASIAEYNLYREQALAGGQEPMSFEKYKEKFGGSQFVTLADGTVVQASRAFGGNNTQQVVSPEDAADATTRSAVNKATSGEQASATTLLPEKKLVFDRALSDLDRLRSHPGRAGAQGVKSASSGFGLLPKPIAGSPEADFNALRQKAAGGAFLEAYQQLKGGGPITDREGEAALAAITILGDPDISEAEQLRALDDYEKAITDGFAKLERQAAGDFSLPGGNAIVDFSTMTDEELQRYIEANR